MTISERRCKCGEPLNSKENIRCAECLEILHKIVEDYHKRENATHRIDIVVEFDPKIISKDEVEKIILARRDCYEIIEYEFIEDNLVRITVYIFSAGQWNVKSIKSYVDGLVVNITFPNGIKKSDITVEVKELNQFQSSD